MSVYPRPLKNGWPHEMASHDSCDTAVGVVAPLPSVKACGAVAGMPDSADTKERICPGPADCPRGEVRAVGFLRGPSSSRRVSPQPRTSIPPTPLGPAPSLLMECTSHWLSPLALNPSMLRGPFQGPPISFQLK
jgi:hypothetical protein